jgi:hypothetical protein
LPRYGWNPDRVFPAVAAFYSHVKRTPAKFYNGRQVLTGLGAFGTSTKPNAYQAQEFPKLPPSKLVLDLFPRVPFVNCDEAFSGSFHFSKFPTVYPTNYPAGFFLSKLTQGPV